MKGALGFVFEEYIGEEKYSHWGFGDLDVIFGDMDSFLKGLKFQKSKRIVSTDFSKFSFQNKTGNCDR